MSVAMILKNKNTIITALCCISRFSAGRISTLRLTEPEHPESLVDLPSNRRRRRRATSEVFVPQTEIKWNSTQEEANALKICGKSFVCQWDLYITGNASVAADTLGTESDFMDAVTVLGTTVSWAAEVDISHIE